MDKELKISTKSSIQPSANKNFLTTIVKSEIIKKYSWVVFAICCLIISYLLIWHRGLYSDDYQFRGLGIDTISGNKLPIWNLPNDHFPMRILVWLLSIKMTGLVPEYEFTIRLFTAICVGGNALLLGIISYRILRSRLISVICGLLFLVPIFAVETVLWLTTLSYVISAGFALLSVYFFQKAADESHKKLNNVIFSVLFFTAMMFSFEGCMAAIGVSFMFSFITLQRNNHPVLESVKLTIKNSIPLILVFGVIVIIFRQSPLVTARGGVDTNVSFLMDRIFYFCRTIFHLTLSDGWGIAILKESFTLGYNKIISSEWYFLWFLVAIVSLIATTLTWENKKINNTPDFKIGLMVVCAGILWTLAGCLIPGVFSKDQGVAYRMLYFPSAGLCITIASILWLILKVAKFNNIFSKVVIGIVGGGILCASISILGHCRIFAERYEMDQKELLSLMKAVPSLEGIPKDIIFVFYKVDQNYNFKDKYFKDKDNISNKFLFGVLEWHYSANLPLNELYKRNDITTVTGNRWTEWKFNYSEKTPEGKQLYITGDNGQQNIPLERTLFVTYKEGEANLVDRLILTENNGTEQIINFPLTEQFKLKGAPTISLEEKVSGAELVK